MMARILMISLRINWTNFMQIVTKLVYLVIWGLGATAPKAAKSLHNFMRKFGRISPLLLLTYFWYFHLSAVQVQLKQKNSGFSFIVLGQTCWLPVAILTLPQVLLCLWNM